MIMDRYLVKVSAACVDAPDDDAAEAGHHDRQDSKKAKFKGGQNKNRDFTFSKDIKGLCSSRTHAPEFSPSKCEYGDTCRYEHNLRVYLQKWKQEDLKTLDGLCPNWRANGKCESGWKCRFAGSHMEERKLDDGRNELVLKTLTDHVPQEQHASASSGQGPVNNVSMQAKKELQRKHFAFPKANPFSAWLDSITQGSGIPKEKEKASSEKDDSKTAEAESNGDRKDNTASYKDPPFLPSEKRRIYFGSDTPVLAPLTTQGNLPFRKLCIDLGAQLTYSEMAMGMPLIQGTKPEWALLRAHPSETLPPKVASGSALPGGYDNARDLRFGAQIAANKPQLALRATEALTQLCPHLRVIDLNCGCPIDLVYRQGAGSALLDNPARLERILYGMGAVSGEVPITAKIRTGTKDNRPTAVRLVDRLVYGEGSVLGARIGSCGVAAITLHGRSRQQRYTRNADWEYIADCAALLQRHRENGDALADTVREPDPRSQPVGGKVYFIGNGDVYSHEDYYRHLDEAGVDGVMVARGAIVRPWVFEEIQKRQYLDKTATERLGIVEQYVRNGLQTWGSDEMGVALTRRFVLEYLSFAYRYVPLGLLEYLPPSLQDRPPAFRGRNEMETLLASGNYKDWIKIR